MSFFTQLWTQRLLLLLFDLSLYLQLQESLIFTLELRLIKKLSNYLEKIFNDKKYFIRERNHFIHVNTKKAKVIKPKDNDHYL